MYAGYTEVYLPRSHTQFSDDDHHMFCMCGSAVKVLSVETGKVEQSIAEVREGDGNP